jgi:hypothetical protein
MQIVTDTHMVVECEIGDDEYSFEELAERMRNNSLKLYSIYRKRDDVIVLEFRGEN